MDPKWLMKEGQMPNFGHLFSLLFSDTFIYYIHYNITREDFYGFMLPLFTLEITWEVWNMRLCENILILVKVEKILLKPWLCINWGALTFQACLLKKIQELSWIHYVASEMHLTRDQIFLFAFLRCLVKVLTEKRSWLLNT